MDNRFDPDTFQKDAMAQAVTRPMSEEDFYYLLGRYPYLEIVNASVETPMRQPVKKSTLQNGWPLFDFGDVLLTGQSYLMSLYMYQTDLSRTTLSATEVLKQYKALEANMEAEISRMTPDGTTVQQFFDAAMGVMSIAMGRWDSARVTRGYYAMQRAAWISAETHNYEFYGFEPTPEDQVVLAWTQKLTPNQIEKGPALLPATSA